MRKFFLLIVFASVGFVALLGSFSFTMIEKQFKNSIDEAFHSTLYITQQGLKSWVEENKHTVNAIATSPKVIDLTKQLLSTQRTPHQLINSPAQKKLRKELSPLLLSHGLRGFFIIAPENVSLASTRDANTGTTNLLMNQSKFLDRLWAGESLITLPQISDVPLKNEKGQLVANYPTMFSGAPIRDQKGEIIALVTLRINPFKTYTQVLQRGHIGSTGETYAFNSSGVMISNSRFDNQLHRLGILEQGKRSMLNVRQIIPSRISLNELPNNQSSTDSTFTLMFKSVLKEKSGRNLDGYLDYRGSKVIGVWIWDDELNIGLATEQDFDEAFKALNTTRVFFVLFCLIIIIGFLIAAFLFELSRKKLEREIEERKSAEKEMKKLSRAIEASPSAIMITNIEGTIEYVNPKFFELTGYSKKDAIGHKTNILKSGETSDYFYEELWKTISSGGEWREDLDDRKKDGDIFRARESITGVKDKKGKITHYIGILDDVSEEFKLSEKLSYQASHDALTCLINRREFEHRTQQLISTAKKHKDEHALCFIDLDQFKVINDTSGHVAGDNLLNQLGRVLRSTVRNRDTLARLGGDEFGVLIENCSLEQANRVVTTILQSIQNFVFEWEGRSFRIGASIGLVAINETTSNPIEVLKQADSACYMAKDLGRNRIHIYKSDDAELALRQGEMHWVSRINQALEENRFQIFAQPIIALDSSEGEHYELLIRMLSEDGKIIQPGAFLPAAERYDLIEKIDLWVIKNAFTILASHSDFVEKIDFISINLSGPSLTNKKFLETIMVLLRESEVLPQKICFEVTETVAISNLNAALTFIKLLKEIGCKFALDDFGSGLSSFGYLKNLPVNYLKIDGMFVKDMVEDPIDYAMVKSINQIGQVMGMKTIAEFVENDEIKGMLKAIGVNYAQGYGIGKPRPLDEYF